MLALVAVRNGVIGADSGYGVTRCGRLEYGANGSPNEARKAGANGAVVAWRKARRKLPAIARVLRPGKEGGGS
jgi:hypothetical protein